MRAESGGDPGAPKTLAPEPDLGDFSRFARYSQGLELRLSLEYRSMFYYSTARSDCTNLELPLMTVLENRADRTRGGA